MSSEAVIDVKGMTCNSCVNHVGAALRRLPGVTTVEIKLAEGEARIVFDPALVTTSAMVSAVEEEGYEARTRESRAV